MLNTTRNKCCVRAYTTYLNINFLIMHPYIVHTKNKLFKNYTTFENIYIYITQHMTNTVHYIWQNITQHMKTNSTTYDTHYNANWWGAMYKVSGQRDEHGRSGDFREWDFVIKRLIYKQFCWTRAGFTTLHGLVPTSTLVPQIYIAFAPRTKGRLYVPPCGRWLVKMVSSDCRPWAGTLKKPQLRDVMTWPRACLKQSFYAPALANCIKYEQTKVTSACWYMIHRHVDIVHCITLPQQHPCRKVAIIQLRVESYLRLVPRPDPKKYYHDDVHESACLLT